MAIMLIVKVLGSGCDNCKKLEALTRQAVEVSGAPAEIIKVTQYEEIMKYPILSTPGLVINEKLVCSGRIPAPVEITAWLASARQKQS
jgi:small redox-active disulfide protein 2